MMFFTIIISFSSPSYLNVFFVLLLIKKMLTVVSPGARVAGYQARVVGSHFRGVE